MEYCLFASLMSLILLRRSTILFASGVFSHCFMIFSIIWTYLFVSRMYFCVQCGSSWFQTPIFLDSLSTKSRRATLVIILAWIFCTGSKDMPSNFTGGSTSSWRIGNPELSEQMIPKNLSITFFSGNFSNPAKYSLIFPDFIDLHIKRASLVGCLSPILLLFFWAQFSFIFYSSSVVSFAC